MGSVQPPAALTQWGRLFVGCWAPCDWFTGFTGSFVTFEMLLWETCIVTAGT